jgi:starch phosphorylase
VRLLSFSSLYILRAFATAVTPRRWLDQCNPELSALISSTLKIDKSVWLKELTRLEGLLPYAEDAKFRDEWAAIKQRNKERLAHHVQTTLGLTINTNAMFDVQIKRLHEYKVRLLRFQWCVVLMRVG